MGRFAAHMGKFYGHSVVGSHRRRDSGAAPDSASFHHQIDAPASKAQRNPAGVEQAAGACPSVAVDGNGCRRPGHARRDAGARGTPP